MNDITRVNIHPPSTEMIRERIRAAAKPTQRCVATDAQLEEQATAIRDHANAFILGGIGCDDTGRELRARANLLLEQVQTLVAWAQPADGSDGSVPA